MPNHKMIPLYDLIDGKKCVHHWECEYCGRQGWFPEAAKRLSERPCITYPFGQMKATVLNPPWLIKAGTVFA